MDSIDTGIGPESDISHIFSGIPEDLINPKNTPEENLNLILNRLGKLGINIHPSCKIAKSTLSKLLVFINDTLSPDEELDDEIKLLLGRCTLSETPSRTGYELMQSQKTRNFNIKIEQGVKIGEDVPIRPSVHIGANTIIHDKVELLAGSSIGKSCVIGRCSYINVDCKIGDCSEVQEDTTFEVGTEADQNSMIVHKNANSTIAKIRKRLAAV